MVSGPLQSGKSSYIKFLDENALNVEAKGADNKYYTVAMDLGSLIINNFHVYLFGTPGLKRFRVMREIVSSGSDGVVFIFDAAAPEKDKDAIEMLNSLRSALGSNMPMIFLANKQDIKNARSSEVIRQQNHLNPEDKVFPTSTKTGLNIKKSLNFLINEIYENYESLFEVLKNYEDDIKGLAEALNKGREEIRDFLNKMEVKKFIELDRKTKTYKVKNGLEFVT
ncbi:MAG: hypothetical protein GF317_10430 [Candidatus Lokiarchaeota archaeon]|nr:hypothetical protein [Candidatus Lokiarchaeota archaeon]MBD3200076.1 hypothetical protein [Candidatus Lokiarchaeota archaeon]